MCYYSGDTGKAECFETQEEGMVQFEEMEQELEEDFTSEDNIYITFYQEEGDVDTSTPQAVGYDIRQKHAHLRARRV